MVSKTRRQTMKLKTKLEKNHGQMPAVTPTPRKSVHLKKVRPNMKGKHKIRMGHESPDIYEGFEAKGVQWVCPTCQRKCRVMGFCVECASGKKHKRGGEGSGMTGLSGTAAVGLYNKEKVAKKAPLESGKKKLKFKIKR
jgi:hypothetical protein